MSEKNEDNDFDKLGMGVVRYSELFVSGVTHYRGGVLQELMVGQGPVSI